MKKLKQDYVRLKKPAIVQVRASKLALTYSEETPPHWFFNDAFATHFMEALSLTFPRGEQFFVNSVLHFKPLITDKEQLQEIAGFIGQEALHSNEHDHLNQLLEKRGFPVKSIDHHLEIMFKYVCKWISPEGQLAITCALEHLTAIFADVQFNYPEINDELHPTIKPIWLWHSIEEAEHKGVAFDLYQMVDGNYFRRIYFMFFATFILSAFTIYATLRLMNKDKSYLNIPKIIKGLWLLFGFGTRAGYMRKQIPTYLNYFKPDFHPWQYDNSIFIAEFRIKVMKMAEEIRERSKGLSENLDHIAS
ncbi:MAG: metal-dependent hydrolase [Bacteriovorax sp.]|nr:metal-dependent hydrolase [Bacteriovorax sp.]